MVAKVCPGIISMMNRNVDPYSSEPNEMSGLHHPMMTCTCCTTGFLLGDVESLSELYTACDYHKDDLEDI